MNPQHWIRVGTRWPAQSQITAVFPIFINQDRMYIACMYRLLARLSDQMPLAAN